MRIIRDCDGCHKEDSIHCGTGLCESCETKVIGELIELNEDKYKQAFNLLMEYFDCLPEEDKPKIDKRLKELGV